LNRGVTLRDRTGGGGKHYRKKTYKRKEKKKMGELKKADLFHPVGGSKRNKKKGVSARLRKNEAVEPGGGR